MCFTLESSQNALNNEQLPTLQQSGSALGNNRDLLDAISGRESTDPGHEDLGTTRNSVHSESSDDDLALDWSSWDASVLAPPEDAATPLGAAT